MFTKQDLIKSAVLIWIVGSVVYIGWDTWRDYQIRGVQQAYQAGVADANKQIFDQSAAAQCKQPFTVTLGGNKLDLIDVTCLQQPQQQAGAAQGAPTQSQPTATQAATKK